MAWPHAVLGRLWPGVEAVVGGRLGMTVFFFSRWSSFWKLVFRPGDLVGKVLMGPLNEHDYKLTTLSRKP